MAPAARPAHGEDVLDSVRPPAVAGSFYPARPAELSTLVDRLLAEARVVDAPRPKALIVPHAGYVYSGPTAASAYARLAAGRRLRHGSDG